MPILRKNRKFNQEKTIDILLKTVKAEWYQFFDKLGLLIVQYSQSTHSSNKNSRILFFRFLEAAFLSDSLQNLSDNEKNILFALATDELMIDSYVLTNIEDLKMLYDRFNVFLRVDHKKEAPRVLKLITRYADKIANSNIVLDKAIDRLDWHFTNLFWVLNVNFYNYIEKDINYSNFETYFDTLHKMNNEIRRWNSDSIFSFRTVLGTYRILRINFKDNKKIYEIVDQTTKNYISKIMKLTENSCFSLTVNEVKECAYIEYVENLADSEKNLFIDLYEIVAKQQVFPNNYNYQSGAFTVNVSFQQQLTDDEKTNINEAIKETYARVEKLKTNLHLNFKKPLKNQIFRLYIFKNNDEYVKYGPLWGVNTAGGGYAHVRVPSENDRPMISYRPLSNIEQWHETFIYQQIGDTRNRISKEGGNFRNLGHEIQHTLFYALLGEQGLHCLPSWMIEGSANALGNENCFKEEADYIKKSKNKLPRIEHIINMSYASGGDLYYFGSALFRFLLARNSNLLDQIMKKAQNGDSINEVNLFIKSELQTYEPDFKKWVDKQIKDCSDLDENQHSWSASENDIQSLYKEDLKNNPSLHNLLKKYSVEFIFNDTVFKLTHNNISRHDITYQKTTQSMSISDYNWLKSTFEIYMLDQQLITLKLIKDKNRIIEDLVDHSGEQLIARRLLEIKINGVEPSPESIQDLNLALKLFVLEKNFKLSKPLRKSFAQEGQVSSVVLDKILISQSITESTCKNYIENQSLASDEMVAKTSHSVGESNPDDKISNIYRQSLNNTKGLKRFIKKYGSVKITFPDTVFELSEDSIKRYDLQGNPQVLSPDDLDWLISALELDIIKKIVVKNGLVDHKIVLAGIVNVEIHVISNRSIRNINPNEDPCLPLSLEDFALLLPRSKFLTQRFQPESQALKNVTSILGVSYVITTANIMLSDLVAKSRELTHVNGDACDEKNNDDSYVTWLLVGGGIVAIICLITGGSFVWNCIRKKAKDKHLNLNLKKDSISDSELEKLISLETEMKTLEADIKHKVSNDAYILMQEKFPLINQHFNDLIDMHQTQNNHNSDYIEMFVKLITSLEDILKKLNILNLKTLVKRMNFILVELRAMRPIPLIAEQQPLLSTGNSNQQENNLAHPTANTFSSFFISPPNNETNGKNSNYAISRTVRS